MHREKELYVDWEDIDTGETGTYLFRKLQWSDRVLPRDIPEFEYINKEEGYSVYSEIRSYNGSRVQKGTSYDVMVVESGWKGSILDINLPYYTYKGFVRKVYLGTYSFRMLVVCTYYKDKPFFYSIYDLDNNLYLGRIADFLINKGTEEKVKRFSKKSSALLKEGVDNIYEEYYSDASSVEFTGFDMTLMKRSKCTFFFILTIDEDVVTDLEKVSRKRVLPLVGNIDSDFDVETVWRDNWFSCFNTVSLVSCGEPSQEPLYFFSSDLYYLFRPSDFNSVLRLKRGYLDPRGNEITFWHSNSVIESGHLICLSNKLIVRLPLSFVEYTTRIDGELVTCKEDLDLESLILKDDLGLVCDLDMNTGTDDTLLKSEEVIECEDSDTEGVEDFNFEDEDIDEVEDSDSEDVYTDTEDEEYLESEDEDESDLEGTDDTPLTILPENDEEIPEWCSGIIVFLDERYVDIHTFCYIFNVEFSAIKAILEEDSSKTLHDALYDVIFTVDTSKRKKSFKYKGTHYRSVLSCCLNENVDVDYDRVMDYKQSTSCTYEEAVSYVFQEKRRQKLGKKSKGTKSADLPKDTKPVDTPKEVRKLKPTGMIERFKSVEEVTSTQKSKPTSYHTSVSDLCKSFGEHSTDVEAKELVNPDAILFKGTYYDSVTELCKSLGIDEYIFSLFFAKNKRLKPTNVVKLFYSNKDCTFYEFGGVHYKNLVDCCSQLGISATIVVQSYLRNKTGFNTTIQELTSLNNKKKSSYKVEVVNSADVDEDDTEEPDVEETSTEEPTEETKGTDDYKPIRFDKLYAEFRTFREHSTKER